MDKIAVCDSTLLILVGMSCFTIIGIAIIACVLFRNSMEKLETIISGPFLPIVTVGAIVGGTVLLAILGLIKENATSVIFGSIIGYVLGSLNYRIRKKIDQ